MSYENSANHPVVTMVADKPLSIRAVLTHELKSKGIKMDKITIIRDDEPEYIVFLDEEKNLRWILGNAVPDADCQKVMMELRHLALTPVNYLDKEHYNSWVKILAHVISLISKNQSEAAREIMRRASEFLSSRAREKARVWVVESSMVASAIVMSICLVSFLSHHSISILLLLTSMGFGVVGTQFSILARLNDITVDPAAGKRVYWKDAIIRIMTGMFAAVILYVALKSQALFGFIDLASLDKLMQQEVSNFAKEGKMRDYTNELLRDKGFWVIALMSTLAGFSERFVPGFLGKLEERSLNELESQVKPASQPLSDISVSG